jgi:hypothetical protein
VTQLDELRTGDVPDMDRVGRCLAELTADTEFFAPLIAEITPGASGDRWRWHAVRHQDGRADLRLADERALHRGDVATLVPPRDVHNHGHVPGTGPYSLILLGDDMLLFDREEYDPGRGTWRALPPGDPGRSNR